MRLKQRIAPVSAIGLLLLLATGCAPDADRPEGPLPDPEEVMLEDSPDQAPLPEPDDSSAEKCIQLATEEDSSTALDPCTRAARDHPDDDVIQQALERAIAATDEPVE